MAIQLMNAMALRHHSISLLTWDQKGENTFYSLDASVNWRKLDMDNPMLPASWSLRLQRQLRIRKIVQEVSPDVRAFLKSGNGGKSSC